jgi:hypothetical protein
MIREEPQIGRIGDFEYAFWECWDIDENFPQAPPVRHWFRSDDGLEALTYDHMLQILHRQRYGLPIHHMISGMNTSEWDRRTPHTVNVNGKDVVLHICERFRKEAGGAPVSVRVVGPNGLVTSSYEEMLERLGIAPAQPAVGDQQSETQPCVVSPPQPDGLSATETEPPAAGSPASADVALAGVQVAGGAFRPEDGKPDLLEGSTPAALNAEAEPKPSPLIPPHADSHPANAVSHTAASALLDAQDMHEAKMRAEDFEKHHPWLWDLDRDQQYDEPINSMHLVWWGQYIKAVYPELAAAALDPEKYQAYIDNYDHERPIPLNEADDDADGDEDGQVGPNTPRCQYIKADGERCGSPALKRKRLCYFHSKTADGRKRRKNAPADSRPDRSSDLELPVLENDRAIQMAVTNICRQLAKESIDPRRASTLLYGLQVAAAAVRRTAQKSSIAIF